MFRKQLQKQYIFVEGITSKRIVTTYGPIGGWVLVGDNFQWIPGPGKFILDKNSQPRWVSYNPLVRHLYVN